MNTEDMNATQAASAIFGLAETEIEGWFAPRRAREAEGWKLDRSHQAARMFWGPSPLPSWAHFEGTIRRPDGRIGALIELRRTGVYVQGDAGACTTLNQAAIRNMLGR